MTVGSYVLLLRLYSDRRIAVGGLGEIDFAAGYYLYCGSALSGIEQRIARHARADKRLHWHIDYLVEAAHLSAAWAIPGGGRLECTARQALAELGGKAVPRFGCSDCRCRSHLLFYPRRPELADFNRSLRQISPLAPEAQPLGLGGARSGR